VIEQIAPASVRQPTVSHIEIRCSCMDAVVSTGRLQTRARDETQSSALPPNSRLPSADERACPHITCVGELSSDY
jgi:hypothetical protein